MNTDYSFNIFIGYVYITEAAWNYLWLFIYLLFFKSTKILCNVCDKTCPLN